jgi:prepilin-type N-terminal cleavage/methylation domain-containing protein
MMRISLRKFGHAEDGTRSPSGKHRQGFAIVEVIVAMVLLGVAISSLAALLYSISQSGMVATGNAYRNGVLMNEVNRLEGIPYDSVSKVTQTVDVTTGSYPHRRVITVTEPIVNVIKTVTVVITPTNKRFKPDTVTFLRTKARTSHVLCKTCA